MIKFLNLHIPGTIGATGGTIVEPAVIGAMIPVDNGCLAIVCPIPKAAMGVGFVFKGAIGATADMPVQKTNSLLGYNSLIT